MQLDYIFSEAMCHSLIKVVYHFFLKCLPIINRKLLTKIQTIEVLGIFFYFHLNLKLIDYPPKKTTKRAAVSVITPSLKFDRTKVSDRKSTIYIAETAHSIGHRIEQFNINRSSIISHHEHQHCAKMNVSLKTL